MGIQVQPCCCAGYYLIVLDLDTFEDFTIYSVNIETGVCSNPLTFVRGAHDITPNGIRRWSGDGVFYECALKDGNNTKPEWFTFDPTTGLSVFVDEIATPGTYGFSTAGIAILAADGTVTSSGNVQITGAGPITWHEFLWSINRVTGIGTQFSQWAALTSAHSQDLPQLADIDYDATPTLWGLFATRVDDLDSTPAKLEWWSFNPADGSGTNERLITELGTPTDDQTALFPKMLFDSGSGKMYVVTTIDDAVALPWQIWQTNDPAGTPLAFVANLSGILETNYYVYSFFQA